MSDTYGGDLDDIFEKNFSTHKTDRVWVAPFYVALAILGVLFVV